MGSSCSSRQSHHDKDNISTKSEESPSYQVVVKKASVDERRTSQGNHSGLILEPKDLAAATTTAPLSRHVPMSSVSDSVSNPSPTTMSPRDAKEPDQLRHDLLQLPDMLDKLVIGRINNLQLNNKTRKIVLYVCAADSQDCCVEKGVLHQVVSYELRNYCREKGYELHVTDLHWKTGLEKQQDHEFPELCLGELARQAEVSYIIPVLFLSNSLGTPLLPKTVEAQDFEMALGLAEDKESLNKWYKLDSNAQPACYRLQPVTSHIPGIKENSWEEREKALEVWRLEIERTLAAMITAFSEELRNTYLTTVVEQEVHNTVLMSQELARRCLWLYRVFTQKPETTTEPTLLDQEQKRRLDILYKDLRCQLTEKHVVRLSLKWSEHGVDKTIPEHAQYVSDVTSSLLKYLKATIFNIIEEDQSKAVIRSHFGIEAQFLNELKAQAVFCQKFAQNFISRDTILQRINKYLTSDCCSPLLVHGVHGAGKTTLLARVIHSVPMLLPDSFIVFRFAKISDSSFNLLSLLSSLCYQLSVLAHGHQTHGSYEISTYKKQFEELIAAIAIHRPIVVIIDGVDDEMAADLSWLPCKLPNNAKLLLSLSDNASKLVKGFKTKFTSQEECIVQVTELNGCEAESLLLSSVVQYSHSVSSTAAECVLAALEHCKLPSYVKVLAWRTSWFTEVDKNFQPMQNVKDEIKSMLTAIEAMLGRDRVDLTLRCLVNTKYGLLDTELLDVLAHSSLFHSVNTHLKWAPACLFLSRLTKYLSPFLLLVHVKNNLTLRIGDELLEGIIRQRYKQGKMESSRMLTEYFQGKWFDEKAEGLEGKYMSQPNKTDKRYNKRKLMELPYQIYLTNDNLLDNYVLNISWVFDKICATDVYQVLDDIILVERSNKTTPDVSTLKGILIRKHYQLTYDGRQFYSQLHSELCEYKNKSKLMQKWLEECESPPCPTLLNLNQEKYKENSNDDVQIDMIARLAQADSFVVSISTSKQQIVVWNLISGSKVRVLNNVTDPVDIQSIDDVRAIVLCKRELRIYDLDKGVLLTKLKGVMNQKMAYFGLHDNDHVVALSRNRMYVNLMNVGTGDLVTTFKVGEDRFLNSLLVSGNGRILVCGDETQKPFPLLVWSLTNRKLLYDLRIPHHDFETSLSAITYEGHYVCCVAKEVDEPGPNFIVVYDLQSGTLFKKWKPGVDTTSLDISSKDSCVVSGLSDARILVWDLVTGNCKWSLTGHTAPVTSLRRDPLGGSFLSADRLNRDRSLRLWDLNKGELMAVYTPPGPVTACELSRGGKHIALALQDSAGLFTLSLRGPGYSLDESKPTTYGDVGNTGKVLDVCESGDVAR